MTKGYTCKQHHPSVVISSPASTVTVSFRKAVPRIPTTTHSVFNLYRYPAKFIPQAVAYVIDHYATKATSVLDPFAGSGTTGLVARLYGLNYELWDLNPLLKVLHEIAIMRPPLVEPAQVVNEMRRTRHRWRPEWKRLDYWFPEEALKLLEEAWGYYHHLEDAALRALITVPLLKVTKLFSFNDPQRQKLSKSPKSVERVRSLMQGDYKERFYSIIQQELINVQNRLEQYQSLLPDTSSLEGRIYAGVDSLEMARTLPEGTSWDILITSPPYLQAQEYIRYSKLELFWLGYSEKEVRELGKREFPYQKVEPFPIFSETYELIRSRIQEPSLLQMYDHYFYAVLGTLTQLAAHVQQHLFLFVGQASVRGQRVPIDTIFTEHFQHLGWKHEKTLVDTIQARVLFRSQVNPATGLEDQRMPTEHMVILKRKE